MKEVQNVSEPVATENTYPVLYGYGDTYCKTVDEMSAHVDMCSSDERSRFDLITYKYIGDYEGRIDVISQQQVGGTERFITATDENTYDSFCSRNGNWKQRLGSLEDVYKAFNHYYGIEMQDDVFMDAKNRKSKVKEICDSII